MRPPRITSSLLPRFFARQIYSTLRSKTRISAMALHPPQASADKLIFAPAGTEAQGQAAQFTLHRSLARTDLDPTNPIAQFNAWFSAARESSKVSHPETCCMSTASLPSGRVSSRMVYMKELDSKGFVLYSNFGTSGKAKDLETNGWVSLTFWWEGMQRQVRVEGKGERLEKGESQKYFETRVRGSRVGAWASRQSEILRPREGREDSEETRVEGEGEGKGDVDVDDGRLELEGWVEDARKRFEGVDDIPVPPFWGGLRVWPERVEFWQGRESRLHDRFVYELDGETGEWSLDRLSP